MTRKNSQIYQSELKELLLLEHSRENSLRVVRSLEIDPDSRLPILLDFFTGDDRRLAQLASTSVNRYFEKHTSEITTYLPKFLEALEKDLHPSIPRNVMRLMQLIDIPEQYESLILERAYEYFMSPTTPGAIRVFSLQVIANMCLKYPELTQEVKESMKLIEDPSKALQSRMRHVRKQLKITS